MLHNRVAGLLWNHRPDSTGMGGWLAMEWVAGLQWNGWPIWTGIRRVGDIEVPRLIGAEPIAAFQDDYNEAIESLANYSVTLEEHFSRLVEDKLRGYWANIITIFGVFVAILGFILVGLPKITTDPSLPLLDIFALNVTQVLPLAIVLAIFVLVLHRIIRKS